MSDVILQTSAEPLDLKEAVPTTSVRSRSRPQSPRPPAQSETNCTPPTPESQNDHGDDQDGDSGDEDDEWEDESMYEDLLNEETPYVYIAGECALNSKF